MRDRRTSLRLVSILAGALLAVVCWQGAMAQASAVPAAAAASAASAASSMAAPATKEAPPAADDPVLEARMMSVAAELRCLVCQNQTIADSHADLAADLRQEIREMLKKGASEKDVLAFMTQRYGDFVLYRPPFKATTALLWLGPGLLLAIGAAGLLLVLRRRQRMSADAFDPDVPDDDDEPAFR